MKYTIACAATAFLMALGAQAGETPSVEGAEVYFIGLEDGATLQSPVTLLFGLNGMGVAPAGTDVDDTGHHHLLINTPVSDLNLDEPMPASDGLIHFGGGQTQATLDLPAGTHTIQLVLGDLSHIPHDPPVMSEVLTITVE